jgi:hypothetical protein
MTTTDTPLEPDFEPDATTRDESLLTQSRPAPSPSPAPAVDAPVAIGRVVDWAAANGFGHDPYIVALGSAAAAGDLASLADVDPWDALPHPDETATSRSRRAARMAHAVRNVAIFLPVALTWFGIRQASAAFGRYTGEADAGGEMTFLEFWQAGGPPDGPSYLAAEWRIGSIALTAALIVLAVIALTLVASWLSGAADRADDRRAAIVERARTALAVELSRDLRRAQSTPTLELAPSPDLANAIDGLSAAAGLVAASAVRLEQATTAVGALGARVDALADRCEALGGQVETLGGRFLDLDTGLDRVGDRVDAIGGRISDGGDRLSGAVDALARFGDSVGALTNRVDGDVSAVVLEAIAGLDDVRAELARTSASIEFGTGRLREDLDAIHAGLVGAKVGRK